MSGKDQKNTLIEGKIDHPNLSSILAMAAAILDSSIRPPSHKDSVFKDECLFSFQTPEMPNGINVCLHCYQSFAPLDTENNTNYTFFHYSITGHTVYLNIQKFFQKEVQEEQLQKKLKLDKVKILQENEDDYYQYKYQLVAVDKELQVPLQINKTVDSYQVITADVPQNIKNTIVAILDATSANLKNDIESWEQEIKPCRHSENVEQLKVSSFKLADKCADCELQENLWICLHCGSLGCGRQQFGGLSGNSHALKHYETTKHPVAVKLGSLSLTQGKADCYCYECNDEIKVTNLADKLSTFDIKADSFNEKNEKTLTELNIQQNLTWQFNMENENGELFQPVFGKNLVGLKNLGNSCYINSTIQLLAHSKTFINLFYDKDVFNFDSQAINKPYDDLYLQLIKIFNGLVGDKYSKPNYNSTDAVKWQKGLSLAIFKALVGKSNQEFNSQNQQDAFEFFLFLLDQIETYYYKNASKNPDSSSFKEDPVNRFKFVINDKLVLQNQDKFKIRKDLNQYLSLNVDDEVDRIDEDGKKHYKRVDINDAIANFFNRKEIIELGGANYIKNLSLNTLPDLLVVQIQRAKLVNWVPTKTDVPVTVPDGKISLYDYLLKHKDDDANLQSPSLIVDEEDKEAQSGGSNVFEPNTEVMNSLLQMGFSENRAKKALYNVGNSSNPEDAMNWLFANMESPDIDEPLVITADAAAPTKTNPNEPTEEEINTLMAMGFNSTLARKALFLTGKNPEAAVEWLFNNPDDDGVIETSTEQPVTQPSAKEQVELILKTQAISDTISTEEADYYLKGVVCHKGNSIHTGHYVVFIRQLYDEKVQWVLYNDEKVVLANDSKSAQEIEKNGYLYLFVKRGSAEDDISTLY